jgi:hypothetical protein
MNTNSVGRGIVDWTWMVWARSLQKAIVVKYMQLEGTCGRQDIDDTGRRSDFRAVHCVSYLHVFLPLVV